MNTIAIIPARYASTRFPGKPLALVHGKPMVVRVWEQVSACASIDAVFVATDDERIEQVLQKVGAKVLRTSPQHTSGTARCFEAYAHLASQGFTASTLLNIQGDEPYVAPEQLTELAQLLQQSHVTIGTLVTPLRQPEQIESPHTVKVVISRENKALYFSRAAIPFPMSGAAHYWKHVGLYGFKTAAITELQKLNESALEKAERLEQLRWIENDYSIHVAITQHHTQAVDTPEDLEKLHQNFM